MKSNTLIKFCLGIPLLTIPLLYGCLTEPERSPYDISPGLWYDGVKHSISSSCTDASPTSHYAAKWALTYQDGDSTVAGRTLSVFVGTGTVTPGNYEVVNHDTTFATIAGKASLAISGVSGSALSKLAVTPPPPPPPLPPVLPPSPPKEPKIKITVQTGDSIQIIGNLKLQNGKSLAFNLKASDSGCL